MIDVNPAAAWMVAHQVSTRIQSPNAQVSNHARAGSLAFRHEIPALTALRLVPACSFHCLCPISICRIYPVD